MFKTDKTETVKQEQTNYRNKCVELESEIEVREIEISILKRKLELKDSELKDTEHLTKKRLIDEKQGLESEIQTLKFNSKNNTENIELKTENAKIKSELDVIKSENIYVKTLLKTYQEMPDMKRMLENLSSIAIPNIEDLKTFTTAVSSLGIKDLTETVKTNNTVLRETLDRVYKSSYRY